MSLVRVHTRAYTPTVVMVINLSGDKSPDFCLYDPRRDRARNPGKGSLPAHGVTASRPRCSPDVDGRNYKGLYVKEEGRGEREGSTALSNINRTGYTTHI